MLYIHIWNRTQKVGIQVAASKDIDEYVSDRNTDKGYRGCIRLQSGNEEFDEDSKT